MSEKEKVMGDELQAWLDDVEAVPTLERFLRGENVLPPEESPLWHMPLQAVTEQGQAGREQSAAGAG